MLIDLSNMSLGIRGTRFNANVKPNGNSEVALAEDSFGNVGQIEISSEGQSTSLTSTDQVIEVTETREIAQREQSEEEKQEFKSVNETLVKVSKIDENELTQQLKEKVVYQIKKNLTPRHIPAKIISVLDIPRTRSGKITELAVRDIVHGKEIKNKEALANPEALLYFANIPDLDID